MPSNPKLAYALRFSQTDLYLDLTARQNRKLRLLNQDFSKMVSHQHDLVEEQAKKSKEAESRAKKTVARAIAIRKEADASELSAIHFVEDMRRK